MKNVDRLSSGAIRCLTVLDVLRQSGVTEVWATVEWFTKRLNTSGRSVKRWTKELEQEGFLAKERKGPKSCIYTILWTELPSSKVLR